MQQKRCNIKIKTLFKLLKILIAISLLIWLGKTQRLDLSLLLSMPISILHLLGLFILLVIMFIQTIRWFWILRTQKINIPFTQVIQLYWIGQFFSLLLPGAAGGELARAYYITRDAPSAKLAGISTVILDRAMGIYALLWLGLLSLLVLILEKKATVSIINIGGVIIVLLIGISLFALTLWFRFTRNIIIHLVPVRLCEYLETILDEYLTHGKELFACFVLSVLANIFLMIVFLLASTTIGTTLRLQQIFLVGPLIIISNSLPISPGGVGVGETIASFLFAQFGVKTGATIMLVVRFGILLLRLPGGLMFILHTGDQTIKQDKRIDKSEINSYLK